MLAIDLSGKVAVVTGVSSGIGKGIAKMLAKAGCAIAGCGLRDASSTSVISFYQEVEEEGQKAIYVSCDVTKTEDLERFVKEVISSFGKIDILISNAGINVFKGAENCSLEDWEVNHNLNLKSHWYLSKLCKPYLDESDVGVIEIMASNHAYTSIPGCFPYNVTKTALTGLVRSMAIEWGPKIRVVGLAPGFIQTEGADKWFNSFDDPKAERERTEKRHPVNKLGSVEEVGAQCAFLASPYSAFITGTTILMDGGRGAIMQDD
ncbi:SDR family oxidoreductase [Flammeovirga sp. MY04]|uniref:SDR family NAD(P)-dependent oxidoreductase n=1 Tax=Flammeovirga sp. MY04 TaxID=1191459 RepID=UPI00080643A3|nr:SDR family oxidoreductase [Flammeovirga sp. MY04]ANQ51660.1 SDR family oxidoreductase [Flammeovirga sp. MY04]